MFLSIIEAELVCSKSPAGVSMRISMGKRRGFGHLAPSSTRASSRHFVRAEGPVISSSPKLVQLMRSSLTRVNEIYSNSHL